MSLDHYAVTAASGSFRTGTDAGLTTLPHRWTRTGIEVHGEATGAHLLHLAVACCVLNDTHREAEALGLHVHGVRVRASGGFDDAWASTGITYAVDIDSPDAPEAVASLLARVDEVAEIPMALRHPTTVTRAPGS